ATERRVSQSLADTALAAALIFLELRKRLLRLRARQINQSQQVMCLGVVGTDGQRLLVSVGCEVYLARVISVHPHRYVCRYAQWIDLHCPPVQRDCLVESSERCIEARRSEQYDGTLWCDGQGLL